MGKKAQCGNSETRIEVDVSEQRCKGCGICEAVCPSGCLRLDTSRFNDGGFHPAVYLYRGRKGACTGCGLCYLVCPDYAVASIKRIHIRES